MQSKKQMLATIQNSNSNYFFVNFFEIQHITEECAQVTNAQKLEISQQASRHIQYPDQGM
jgi:hypothetical protein